jgi:hypothetical protein
LDLVKLLDGLPRDGTSSSGLLGATCPACGAGVEVRLGNGAFEVGYTYWAGSLHFEALQRVRVAGLKLRRTEPDGLEIDLRGRRWSFAVDRPAQDRFVIFANAFAAGKQIGQLDFSRLGVSVLKVERRGELREPGLDWELAEGDFLHLRGPAPALTRAWHYLNKG